MSALQFLLLEANPLDAEVVQAALKEGGIDCELLLVDTRAAFIRVLESNAINLILADYALSSFDEIGALTIARRLRPEIPFIFISGSLGEELAIEAIKQGATDYVLKQRLGRLVPSVQRALREVPELDKDIIECKQAKAAIESDLKDTQLLHELSARLVTQGDIQTLYQEIIAAAIALTRADAGTAQILDEATQELLLLATQGFERNMTEYFYRVNASSNTPCSIALKTGARIFVDFDVRESEDPDGSMRMHVDAGYLSAQSTPLITRSGKTIGMVSTHWRKHHRPSDRELRFLDLLARQAADLIEQRQAQVALRESEERFRAIANLVPDLLWDSEPNGSTNWYNQRWMEYTGQTFDEAIGWGWIDAIHPDDCEASARRYREAVEQSVRLQQEHRIRRHDGEYRWFVVNVFPLKDESGKVVKMYGAATDIHEQRVALEALRESEERFRTLANTAPALIWYNDAQGNNRFINQYFQDFTGKSAEQIRGEGWHELVHPDDAELYIADYLMAVREQRSWHNRNRIRRHDGVWRWHDNYAQPLFSTDGVYLGHVGVTIDNTVVIEAEIALREREEKFRTLFETIDEGFVIQELIYDENGKPVDVRLLEANPAHAKLTGLKNVVGKSSSELGMATESYWFDKYDHVIKTGEALRFENWHEPTRRWYDVYLSRVGGIGSRKQAIVFNDITDRKRREMNAALLAEIGKDLSILSAPDDIIQTVGERLGEFLQVSTCIFADVDEAKNEATIHHGWNTEDVPSLKQTFRLADYFGEEFLRAGRAGESVIVCDTARDERADAEAYARLKLGAFVTVPFQWQGRWTANITVTSREPRDWRADEIELLQEIASRVFPRIERARAEEALRMNEKRIRIQKEAFQSAINGEPLASSLNILTRIVKEQLGSDVRTAFYLAYPDGASLYAIDGAGDMPQTYTVPVDGFPIGEESFCSGYAIATGCPALTRDVFEDPVWQPYLHLASAQNFRSCGSYPILTSEGKAIGSFAMYFTQVHEATRQESAVADAVTQAAAIILSRHTQALERARAEASLRESELERVQEQSAREQERQRAEALAELDRAKTVFFSNISHELRTPLTLSLAPLQDALSDSANPLPQTQQERLELAHRNSLRLLKLVNTLLDFSRIEADRLKANYEPTDLSTYTAELASVFRSAIENANLQLVVDCPPLPDPIYVDREMWEKIVLNLLSNALKFTFEGMISVSLKPKANTVELMVSDTGVGIAASELPHIFERFYQVKGAKGRSYEGSGIGLSLVQELVKRHGGAIALTSAVDQGTTFTVTIPTGIAHLPADQIEVASTLASTVVTPNAFVDEALRWLPEESTEFQNSEVPAQNSEIPDQNSEVHVQNSEIPDQNSEVQVQNSEIPDQNSEVPAQNSEVPAQNSEVQVQNSEIPDQNSEVPAQNSEVPAQNLEVQVQNSEVPAQNSKRARILLVDDNADMRGYLRRLLNQYYEVEAVNDGLAALNAIRSGGSAIYDIVLADVMMPRMDGFELLRSLRASPNTQTIPIILLSARAGEESRVEGLETGADDYLIKPFSARELLARVNANLQLAQLRREAVYREQVMQAVQTLNVRLEQQVKARTAQLEAINQELEAFSSSVSHDLRTPLRHISSFAERLQDKLNPTLADASSLQTLNIIMRSALQAEKMVNDLLEFSRLGQTEMSLTTVNIGRLVQQVQAQLQPELIGRSLHWEIEPLATVKADPVLLRLVLQNLLSNAVKFTRNNAEAAVKIGRIEQEQEVIFFVKDNGAGFDMKYCNRLFSMFQRLHPQEEFPGTGVGLATVRRIIHRHGGRIWAKGAIDQGATFYFSLPKHEAD